MPSSAYGWSRRSNGSGSSKVMKMSFTGTVKEELSRQCGAKRHCQIAELTAVLTMCGGIAVSSRDRAYLRIQTENLYVARKTGLLLHRLFHIDGEVSVRAGVKKHYFTILVPGHEDTVRVLTECGLMEDGTLLDVADVLPVESGIVSRTCCARAFLRGAFLVSGSVSDPRRYYHLEIVCASREKARQLGGLIRRFNLDAKIVERKSHYVVYLKEGAQIVDMLGIMEAHKALMELENIRILREISNSVNRQVNCETANLGKIVGAAVKQIEDIRYIQERRGLGTLPDNLRQMAQLRLQCPDTPLKELGQMMDPPLGKSGVNHRLKKLSQIADNLREESACRTNS